MKVPAVLFLLLLAGCVSESPENTTGASELPEFTDWYFSDCHGVQTGVTYPGNTGPGEAPPGWEFDATSSGRYATRIRLDAVTCNRVSLLGHERGPVAFIFETHSKHVSPESCRFGNYDALAILSRLFVSDASIAESLDKLGVPVEYSEIEVVYQDSTISQQKWTWSHFGAESWMESAAYNFPSDVPDQIERLAWWDGKKLGLLDVKTTVLIPQVATPIVRGEFGPGMLYSGSETKTFIGAGDFIFDSTYSAKLQFFQDPACMEPEVGR